MVYETLIIGLALALLWVEIFKVYPGGLIVPAYLALYLDHPYRVLATMLFAFLSLLIYRILAGYLLVYGRRRFVLFILLGAALSQTWFLLTPHLFSSVLELRAVGWLIPGLLANNLERQKILPTLVSLGVVAVTTYFSVKLLSVLL